MPCPWRRCEAGVPRVLAFRHTRRAAGGTLIGMDDVVYMVRADTQGRCLAELDRLCRLLDARPTLLPHDGTGRGWVARAVPARPEPDTRAGE